MIAPDLAKHYIRAWETLYNAANPYDEALGKPFLAGVDLEAHGLCELVVDNSASQLWGKALLRKSPETGIETVWPTDGQTKLHILWGPLEWKPR
jgi:hypothetical protein